jgi:hypothetical protein
VNAVSEIQPISSHRAPGARTPAICVLCGNTESTRSRYRCAGIQRCTLARRRRVAVASIPNRHTAVLPDRVRRQREHASGSHRRSRGARAVPPRRRLGAHALGGHRATRSRTGRPSHALAALRRGATAPPPSPGSRSGDVSAGAASALRSSADTANAGTTRGRTTWRFATPRATPRRPLRRTLRRASPEFATPTNETSAYRQCTRRGGSMTLCGAGTLTIFMRSAYVATIAVALPSVRDFASSHGSRACSRLAASGAVMFSGRRPGSRLRCTRNIAP